MLQLQVGEERGDGLAAAMVRRHCSKGRESGLNKVKREFRFGVRF